MNVIDVPLAKLRRRTFGHPVDAGTVKAIAQSISAVGLLQPLRVRPKTITEGGMPAEGYEITAGAHRFEAARTLNLATVPCIIVEEGDLAAELAMLDENLMRAELSPAERARSTARRKAIYLELHPEADAGARRAAGMNAALGRGDVAANVAATFATKTAAATGRSERAVQRDAERGDSITAAALEKVRGTVLDTGAYLDKLKKVVGSDQEAQVEADLRAGAAPAAHSPRDLEMAFQAWFDEGRRWFRSGPPEWRARAQLLGEQAERERYTLILQGPETRAALDAAWAGFFGANAP